MRVSIDKIKVNPFRDFTLDPIDPDQVAKLAGSHKQVGQFGAVPVRPSETDPGYYEQACGHHNVEAMRLRGDTEVNVESRERSDDEMVKLLRLENLTQRTSNAGAVADALAATIRLAARELLQDVPLNAGVERSRIAKSSRTQWLKDGPGEPMLYARMNGKASAEGVDDDTAPPEDIMTMRNLRATLSTLKATGHVARIMSEEWDRAQAEWDRAAAAQAEIDRRRVDEAKDDEERERLAAEAAQRAEEQAQIDAQRAKEAEVIHDKAEAPSAYDVRCVSVFNVPQQEQAFRAGMMSSNGLRYIPKENQLPFALKLKSMIDETERRRGHTLGSTTVKDFINDLLRDAILAQSQIDKDEEAQRRLQENDEARIQRFWDTARKGLQQSVSALEKLGAEQKEWNYYRPFPVDSKFTAQLRGVSQRVDRLIRDVTGLGWQDGGRGSDTSTGPVIDTDGKEDI